VESCGAAAKFAAVDIKSIKQLRTSTAQVRDDIDMTPPGIRKQKRSADPQPSSASHTRVVC
jgi:hypothetical protein